MSANPPRPHPAAADIRSRLPGTGTTIFTVVSQLAQELGAVNLGQGFPDFDSDPRLQELATEALRSGHNQYAPMAGLLQLRQAVSAKVAATQGHHFDPDLEITVTAGATQALFTAILAFVGPGDEVIVLEPVFDCYGPAIALAGAVAIGIPLQRTQAGFRVDWVRVEAALSPRTRLIIVNSPHNPTGMVFDAGDIAALERLADRSGALVLSDEVYEHIIFDGRQHLSVCRSALLAERSLVVSSFGKTFHCTGWKIGTVCAPRHLSAEFRKVHQFNVFAVNHPLQIALARYLEVPSPYRDLPDFYQARRDHFLEGLAQTRFRALPCAGTYFAVASYEAIADEPDAGFATRLLRQHGVASIPVGAFYSTPTDARLVRFCFGKRPETLDAALDRLRRV